MQVTLETVDYLLCALGDGYLFSFILDCDIGTLRDRKKVCILKCLYIVSLYSKYSKALAFENFCRSLLARSRWC